MWKGVLPIGSVVLLKGGDRKVMICGVCVTKEDDDSRVFDYSGVLEDDDSRVFDYSGVLYPDGLEDPDKLYLFNRDSIEQVFYVGYMDENSEEFLPQAEKMLGEK